MSILAFHWWNLGSGYSGCHLLISSAAPKKRPSMRREHPFSIGRLGCIERMWRCVNIIGYHRIDDCYASWWLSSSCLLQHWSQLLVTPSWSNTRNSTIQHGPQPTSNRRIVAPGGITWRFGSESMPSGLELHPASLLGTSRAPGLEKDEKVTIQWWDFLKNYPGEKWKVYCKVVLWFILV